MIYLDNKQETQTVAIDINTDAGQYFPIVPEEPNMYYTQVQVDNKFTNYYDKEQTYSKGEVYNTDEVDTQVFSLRRSVETTKEEVETDLSVEVNRLDKRVDDVEFKVDNIDLSGAEGGAYILEYVGDYDEQWWDGVDWETYEMINYSYADSDRQTHNADIFQKVKNGDVKALYYKMPSGMMVEVEDEEKGGIRTINEWKYVPLSFGVESDNLNVSGHYRVGDMHSDIKVSTDENGVLINADSINNQQLKHSVLTLQYNTIEGMVDSGELYIEWGHLVTFLENITNISQVMYAKVPTLNSSNKSVGGWLNGTVSMTEAPWLNGTKLIGILYLDSVTAEFKKVVFEVVRSNGTYSSDHKYTATALNGITKYNRIRPKLHTTIG